MDPARAHPASMGVPDLVGDNLQRWRSAGLQVGVQELGYTSGVDDQTQSARDQVEQALQRIQLGRRLLRA